MYYKVTLECYIGACSGMYEKSCHKVNSELYTARCSGSALQPAIRDFFWVGSQKGDTD